MTWVPGNLRGGADANTNKVEVSFWGTPFFWRFSDRVGFGEREKWGFSIKTSQTTQSIWVNGSQFKSGYFLLALDDVGRGSLWVCAKLEVWVKKQ